VISSHVYCKKCCLIFSAVSITGFICSAAALPFDNCKMKLMKMVPGKDGKLPYDGVIDCFRKVI